MRPTKKERVRLAFAAAALVSCTIGAPARAEDDATGEPTPAAQATAPPDGEPKPKTPANQSLGPFERLPLDAYPEPRTRGLRGGSLWMTFHGLQWPYYPKTGIGVSGYVWMDTGYEHLARGEPLNGSAGNQQAASQSSTFWVQQGRLLLRVDPTWSNGEYFVQGQGEFVGNKLQQNATTNADIDEVWVRAGKWNAWDFQVGRFQAWDVMHLGMGLDLYTLERQAAQSDGAPDLYGVTFAYYLPPTIGQAALHLYPTDWLRFELSGQYGADTVTGQGGSNGAAIRPVAVIDLGWLKLKGGAEYKRDQGQIDGSKQFTLQRGGGGAIQVVIDPYVEFGVNAAYAVQDQVDARGQVVATNTWDEYTVGGFANARLAEGLLVGTGFEYSFRVDTQFDPMLGRDETFDQYQAFGAVQYLLFNQLYIKGVFAYALADFNPNMNAPLFKDEMLSGRVRLLYLF